MPERFKHFKARTKEKIGRFFGKSPTQSTHSGSDVPPPSISASRAASPMPQAAVSDPSPSQPASPPPKARSPDADTAPQSGLQPFQQVLTTASGLLGPLQPVINDLGDFFEAYKDAAAADSDLHSELQSLLNTLNRSFPSDVPPVIAKCVGNLCRSISEELDKISVREKGGTGRRLWEANKDLAKARVCRDQIRGYVDTATLEIVGGHGTMLREQGETLAEHRKRLDVQEKSAEEREKILDEHTNRLDEQANLAKKKAIEEQLEKLKPSLSACYNSSEATNLRRECTTNTRKEVLSDLDNWRRDPNGGNIFWMNGMAGTGKTTIANTLSATLEAEQKLGASFFCSRQLPECRSVKLIIPTIAYQLARFSPTFRDALSKALESKPDLSSKDLSTQLEGLILSPLRDITEPLSTDVVIVIDALDECEERSGVEDILGVFMARASALPLKVFVSSRPEEEIRRQIGGTKSKVVLHELDKETVKEDISLYLHEELKGTSISPEQVTKLVERAGVLFIYASTVVRFIKSKSSSSGQQNRLKIVLSSSIHESKIDELYTAVLESAFSDPELLEPEKAQMRDIIHTVVCAQEPLTADALAGLLQLGDGDLVLDALEPLWSVIHVSGPRGTSLVTTLHASFPDYMLDLKRSDKHGCDKEAHHGRLAELCFERIDRNQPQFNICDLESSYRFDDQVRGLEESVKQKIPLDLFYACQFWAVHLRLGGSSIDRTQRLENFLSKRLLMWMEVLNLKRRMDTGAVLLENAKKWCTDGGASEAIGGLVHDAWRFVTTFATNPVSRSTPHIYVSMLAFWPSSKLITECYVKQARGLAEVTGSGMSRRQFALLSVFAMGSWVNSVALSPDGMRIICGCDNRTISVWDAQSGKVVLGPLTGHTSGVNSVACSPDGLLIASGSHDETIRVWDAQSGKMVLEPLKGHVSAVYSIAFSPDSRRIVSGSYNSTIRVWDAQNGVMVLGPLRGHTLRVLSVAFSHDGMRIASGSIDKTIRVWDSQSGQLALEPLKGHTADVTSVAFSPDDNQIVSASRDRTIRVWDARSGKTILEPLEGHTNGVTAVAFSPDGTHIVSGSYDKSICIWDAKNGKVVLGPLEGHSSSVTSVAFSPDGMRVISGSVDQTIRMWDAQSGAVASGSAEGHTASIRSVAFAPDGNRIVSGSNDETVRVWDVKTGQMVLGPLGWRAGMVRSVAFSPDSARIAAGSNNFRLLVWDAQNGNVVLGPLSNNSSILSVAFSPDSTRIVSGSQQIDVRDVQSGKVVLGPLKGHTDWVRSVAFSSSGLHIISGSDDRTLRMWDAQTGNMVLGPLQGHTGAVNAVAFSPDGLRIVSGSKDRTLRVWDAQSGDMVLGPLEGHTSPVTSVAFSPNGTYIVSGSEDKTIRVWAARTGDLVLGPLRGHFDFVHSVSFSPDNTHIASGSDDKAIRVWRLPGRLLAAESEPYSLAVPPPSHAVGDSPATQPAPSLQSSSDIPLQWSPELDGWLVDEQQHAWVWVPTDLRASFILPHNHNTFVMPAEGLVEINFDGAAIGESWVDCYSPA